MKPPGRRRTLALLCLAAIAGMPLCAPAADALTAGELAPAFRLPGRDQQVVELSGLRGKVVLLHFWASWCPACQQSFVWLNRLQAQYADQGLQVLGIGVDTRQADALAFLEQHPAGFLLAFDTADRVPRSYAVRAMPALLLIDRKGRIQRIQDGFAPAGQIAFEQAIRAQLATP